MAPNPYAPPQAPAAPLPSPSDTRLFGPAAIATHAILLTPLVAAILASLNHRRRGDAPALRRTLLTFGLPSAILLVLLLAGGEHGSGLLRLVTFVWSFSVARLLYEEHSVLVRKHVDAGGRLARWYLATLITLAVFVGLGVTIALVDTFLHP